MQFFETNFQIYEIAMIWRLVRFVILFMLLFTVIYGVYFIAAPKNTSRRSHLPGALAASIILVAASALYSQLITASIRYEILYGSLASFVIIMIWLYTCSLILIAANVVNITIRKKREVKESERLSEAKITG
jgi:membrane protein